MELRSSYRVIDNRSLTWYLICRTAVVTLLLGGAAALYLQGRSIYSIYPLFILIAISYIEAVFSALLTNRVDNVDFFAQVQIAWDLLFVTALIILTGGVESIFSFAYLLIIVSASFLLSRRTTVLAAAAAVVLFGGVLDLQFFNYLEFVNLTRSVPDGTFFSTLFVHSVAFFLSALLSGTLADRWRKTEEQLQQKSIDLAELEKMNRTILEHINSGLMMIGDNREIKSFNRAATDITGLSLEDVYGRQLDQVFPDLLSQDFREAVPSNRSEGRYVSEDGSQIILGFATTPARTGDGEQIGTLITFQDLTQLKKIEEDLKRVDRLAAVGRLAASMAHEIRNPLTSISGSVQLLAEDPEAIGENRNLMRIVINEADRLNGLLTNFLYFARPKTPEKEKVDSSVLINELFALFKADPRFVSVELIQNCGEQIVLFVDRQQVQQALWDLAINASEAMGGEGVLKMSIVSNNLSTIIVEDNGPGISDQSKNQIFEPFFSTKEKGSGLGLASVHAVMEAHGGSISVGRSALGGARFSLTFPE